MLPDILVCATQAIFADDQRGLCVDCHTVIVFRPHSAWVPTKVCQKCSAQRTLAATLAGGTVNNCVTQQTIDEVLLFYMKAGKVQ